MLTRWFAVGRLRVSALALTEDALRPRAELCSATEPPNLQFPQRVGFKQDVIMSALLTTTIIHYSSAKRLQYSLFIKQTMRLRYTKRRAGVTLLALILSQFRIPHSEFRILKDFQTSPEDAFHLGNSRAVVCHRYALRGASVKS